MSNIFTRFRNFIKKKSPATFNAAEYETSRVLNRIQESEKITADIQEKTVKAEQRLNDVSKQLDAVYGKLDALSKELTVIDSVTSELKDETYRLHRNIDEQNTASEKKTAEITHAVDELKQMVSRCDLNSIASCKSDNDYDNKLIPLNRYFNNRGMAVSMHLTSVAEKPDPIVYETADIIRTGTFSLIADEIHARSLDGAVAELGVAQGKFARVINALFPEKTLHLFDTFEGFPESDALVDKENNFSNTKPEWYADIDINGILKSMRYPEKCILHKGYFPETAQGLEESFCFVNIDCDLYKPILAGLEYFYPRLVKGGYIFVHDYRSKYFTGVKAALNEFAEKNNISYCVIPDNTGTAVIVK